MDKKSGFNHISLPRMVFSPSSSGPITIKAPGVRELLLNGKPCIFTFEAELTGVYSFDTVSDVASTFVMADGKVLCAGTRFNYTFRIDNEVTVSLLTNLIS